MKQVLFTLAALCAGLVGAAEFNWTSEQISFQLGNTSDGTYGKAQLNLGKFDANAVITMTVSYNVRITPSNGAAGPGSTFFSVGWGSGELGGNGIPTDSVVFRRVNLNGYGPVGVVNATNSGSETSGYVRNPINGAADDYGNHTLTISLNLATKTLTVQVDGNAADTLTFPTNAIDPTGDLLLGINERDWILVTDVTGTYTVPGEEEIPEGIPEPTALALLALGVAGVALRRKVA